MGNELLLNIIQDNDHLHFDQGQSLCLYMVCTDFSVVVGHTAAIARPNVVCLPSLFQPQYYSKGEKQKGTFCVKLGYTKAFFPVKRSQNMHTQLRVED